MTMIMVLILFLSSIASLTSLVCAILVLRKRTRLRVKPATHRVTIILENGSTKTITMTGTELDRLLGTG